MVNYETSKLPLYEEYKRIELPYQLGDLEQIISLATMRFHYAILHQNYENKLLETLRGRKIAEESEIEKKFPTLIKLLENLEILPEEIKDDVRFFGGGLINHNFFFLQLTPFKPNRQEYELEEKISLALLNLIQQRFTNLKGLKRELIASALRVRGAG
ncbi:4995_t:CDS:1 [Entrophospora sp. SA101]|nr:9172_t:CDS:1 [Entrophospora sp. SA101]CAJ0833598.1 4995_t:CDS:1 [Entrophospora sp. SA101]